MTSYDNIDAYIAAFPKKVQELLEQMRQTIHQAAPDAVEKISYSMPTFTLKGNLVHFAAYKNHIGFYPTPSGINNFRQELAGYKTSKGAIQFPINEQIPLDLINKIVAFRVNESLRKEEAKTKNKLKA